MKLFLLSMLLLLFFGTAIVYAQDDGNAISKNTYVTGSVEKISENDDYMVVDGKIIKTTKDFLEEADFEIGDKITVETISSNDEDGLIAVDYSYYFEDSDYEYPKDEESIQEEIITDSSDSNLQEQY